MCNITAPTLPQITAIATLNWKQYAYIGGATSKGMASLPTRSALWSARGNNLSFQKQQDSIVPSGQQQEDSTKDKEKGHGKYCGKKQREKKKKKYLNFIESKDSESEGTSSYFIHTTAIPTVMDPCIAAYQSVQLYQGTNGLPMFTQTQESFDFAHHLGIESLMKYIHSLDTVCYSRCECCIPYWPGNIYDDDYHPVNQLKDIKSDEASASSGSRIPESFPDAMPLDISIPDVTAADLSEDEIEHITREGGGALNTYLLSKIIWLDSTITDPSKKPICEWTYRGIYTNSLQIRPLSEKLHVVSSLRC